MSDNGHRDDPDPIWDLDDFDTSSVDDAGRPRVPVWVIVIVILIALALILQLAWPLVADLLDRGGDSRGFPTPGVV